VKLAIGIAALSLVMVAGRWLWLHRSAPARPHVPPVAGVVVLRPPRRTAVMLGAMAALPAGLLAAIAVRAWMGGVGRGGVGAVVAGALLMAAVSAHQLAAAFRQHVVVNEWGIERVGVILRRHARWADVATVAYNPLHHWFYFTTVRRTRFWVSEELHGIGDFAAVALKRLPPAALEADPSAREQLEELSALARDAAQASS
jgi:Bacterial PH domain